jgi:hypothetical protein
VLAPLALEIVGVVPAVVVPHAGAVLHALLVESSGVEFSCGVV